MTILVKGQFYHLGKENCKFSINALTLVKCFKPNSKIPSYSMSRNNINVVIYMPICFEVENALQSTKYKSIFTSCLMPSLYKKFNFDILHICRTGRETT